MMDEAYLLEHVKEQLCFVSQDLRADLAAARTRRSPHRSAGGEQAVGRQAEPAAWRADRRSGCALVEHRRRCFHPVRSRAAAVGYHLAASCLLPHADPPSPVLRACRREYVLPDGITDTWGHVRTEEEAAAALAAAQQAARGGGPPLPKQQVLVVNNERFMVPEALFHPTGAAVCEDKSRGLVPRGLPAFGPPSAGRKKGPHAPATAIASRSCMP